MSISSKIKAIKDLTVNDGSSALTIDTGDFTLPTAPKDSYIYYRLVGTSTLTSDMTVVTSGTLHDKIHVMILFDASVTLSGNDVVILGKTIPAELVNSGKFLVEAVYNATAVRWVVIVHPDFGSTGFITNSLIANDAVNTNKIVDDAVTNAKLANITRGSIKVGGASDAPTDLDAKTSGNILVGDGTDVVSVAVSGDATLSSAGALTIANSAVTTAKIDDSAVTTVKLDDGAVTASKLDSNLNKAQITIPISFEDASELGVLEFKICFDCTVDAIHGTVAKPFASVGTHIFKDDTGTVLTGSQIDMSSALTLGNIVSVTPTANNTFSAGDVIKIETSTSGADGGKSVINLCCTKL